MNHLIFQQQQKIDRITQLAQHISLADAGPCVELRYNGSTNQLFVTVHNECSVEPQLVREIDLASPSDSEFTQRRVIERLAELAESLQQIVNRYCPPQHPRAG